MLEIKDLSVRTEGKEIVHGITLTVKDGEVHAIMGPNGSGKTTFAYALSGHPKYQSAGSAKLDGKELLGLPANERAKAGLFLAFQNPAQVEGLGLAGFIRKARQALGKNEDLETSAREAKESAGRAKMDEALLSRDLNFGLSGGERKKSEIVQMLSLSPKVAILDEIDSGLDVDALKAVAHAIAQAKGTGMAVIAITHHSSLLGHLKPDYVHVIMDGRIIKSGGAKFAKEIEKKGYEWMKE